jgi:hypothetical protein
MDFFYQKEEEMGKKRAFYALEELESLLGFGSVYHKRPVSIIN